jgi:hypothetical protein
MSHYVTLRVAEISVTFSWRMVVQSTACSTSCDRFISAHDRYQRTGPRQNSMIRGKNNVLVDLISDITCVLHAKAGYSKHELVSSAA